jgi:nitroimidazol reductase NimA-like FMN-containing flavoprotein (pyridoxamine 5'-phosphate oxidase superfamily)
MTEIPSLISIDPNSNIIVIATQNRYRYAQLMSEAKREIKRKPHRSVEELAEIYSILDEGMVAHVGFIDPTSNEPVVIPVAYGRDGDRIFFHGSTGSRMFMALKSGVQICATVTLLDGIVSARTPFNSSMNYRSVMAFGVPKVLEGEDKEAALYVVSERLIPGLWKVGREQTKKEFAQTLIVELKLDDLTAKKRTGEAIDDEGDEKLPIWAGIIPIKSNYGEPVTNINAKDLPIPDYIKNLVKRKAE